VKKKKRRTTDLEKESTEDVEEESRGGRSGDRKEAGSECDGGNTKEGGGMQNSNAGGFECRTAPD